MADGGRHSGWICREYCSCVRTNGRVRLGWEGVSGGVCGIELVLLFKVDVKGGGVIWQ